MNYLSRSFAFARSFVAAHKIRTALIVLVVGGAAYWWFGIANQQTAQAQYVTAPVTRGTLEITVSGSGQVAAADQVDVKTKVSGEVIAVRARNGQSVSTGDPLVFLDTTDAEKSIRDAQANLDSANIALDKLTHSSADVTQLLQEALGDISNTFLDLPNIISNAEEIILGSTINPKVQDNKGYYQDFVRYDDSANYQADQSFIAAAESDYRTARTAYDATLIQYKNTNINASSAALRSLLDQTASTTRFVAQALKSEQNLFDFLTTYAATYKKTLPASITGYQSDLRTEIGQVNSHLSALVSDQNSVDNAPLDIQSQQLTVTQRENALADAKATLADYTIRAPFSGIVASISLEPGDSISGGATVATLITKSQIAQISLNEVDAAKVAVGQKAHLSFDAFPDLTLDGTVSEVDTLGTVSQGVVNYNVNIAFDTQDSRIKPGMSVTANIITASKSDVLLVPNAAVKTQGNFHYVEVPPTANAVPDQNLFRQRFASSTPEEAVSSTAPGTASSTGRRFFGSGRPSSTATAAQSTALRRIPVEIGLANDTMTEIISGITEGTQVVTRTVTNGTSGGPTNGTTQTTARTGGGAFFLGGGGVRPRD